MNADQIKAIYRKMCLMDVIVRRYASGTPADFPVKGHYRQVSAKEIIGTIVQGDLAVIVLVDDLVAAGVSLPLLTADRVFLGGRERRIVSIGERRALDSALVAYDVLARG